MNATCIVQARMGSNRMPGKIMRKLKGKPILWHVVERIKASKTVNQIIIATSDLEQDDIVNELASAMNIECIRGSEDDVLDRYVKASKIAKNEVLIRITSDCPLIDPKTIDKCVERFIDDKCDYLAPTCEGGILRGLDTEVFSKKTLIDVSRIAKKKSYREHVTLYIYKHPEKYVINRVKLDNKYSHPTWRLCVDEEVDYILMSKIYDKLYKENEIIDINDVVDYLNKNENLIKINSSVKQIDAER